MSGGRRCYGYDLVPGQTGVRRIDEPDAASVRRIFEEYPAGRSPRAIAMRLNQEGVPGARGGPWRDTTIRGHFTRGAGILNNELYIGRLEWNRQRFMKDRRVAVAGHAGTIPAASDRGGAGPAHRRRRALERRQGPPDLDS